MYYYGSWNYYEPKKKMQLIAPRIKATSDVSVVMPVRNNQAGVNNFFKDFFETQSPHSWPLEIIVVNDGESTINLPEICSRYPIEIRCFSSNRKGPSYARNIGWRHARGEWILFTNSDCRPAPGWLEGYIQTRNGSVGYAGKVLSYGRDRISKYYESQNILMPSMNSQESVICPDYLVTANALVWKKALEKICGFNESLRIAAGEDIDLGIRLREIGSLSFAFDSIVYHDFDDGLKGFVRRFRRYGKGNHLLAQMYGLNIKPSRFKPQERSFVNSILAYLQYASMLFGWYVD
jgi:glycosyltransferase involved in cell wall biosynthesis